MNLKIKLHILIALNVGAQTLKSNIDKINREYFIETNGYYVFRIWRGILSVLPIDRAFKYQEGLVSVGVERVMRQTLPEIRNGWNSRITEAVSAALSPRLKPRISFRSCVERDEKKPIEMDVLCTGTREKHGSDLIARTRDNGGTSDSQTET